ncbi:MAG: hypothetical protein ABL949_07330 [Fimbriimonadaceae bacterium]
MTYKKLGEMLVQGGLITSLQLSIALAAQQTSNRRLGEIVVERGFCTEEQISLCLAEQFGYEVADLSTLTINPDAITLLKAEFALEQGVLPIDVQGDDATFVIYDPVNVDVTDQVAMITKKRSKYLISARTALVNKIRETYSLNEGVTTAESQAEVPARYGPARPLKEISGVQIYESTDHQLGRMVTLFATSNVNGDPEFVNRIQSAARTSTPSVASVHDLFEFDGQHWVVLEKIEGETLSHVLKTRGARTLPQATALVAQIAEGIDALHQRGGYVGLICPENIVISGSGAKLVPLMAPSHSYTSPEGTSATPASDIFALGTLLWECLTGQRPHQSGTWELPTSNASLPLAMVEVLNRALAQDPQERFASALLLSSAMKSYNWSVISTPRADMATPTTKDREQLLSIMTSGQSAQPKPGFWQRLFRKVAA